MLSSPSFARAVASSLARHTDRTFGLVGPGNVHLVQSLGEVGVPYTSVRHGAAAVAAADAYARISGRLAVATTSSGAAFTDALTALAEAAKARTPMLVVVGDEPTTGPRPWDVDQDMLSAALGVRTRRLKPKSLDKQVDKAVARALNSRMPVILAIPADLQTMTTEGIDPDDPAVLADLIASVADTPRTITEPVDVAPLFAVEEAARTLLSAERPLILAGHGAHLSDAGEELGLLADSLGALTATTTRARGIFPAAQFDLGVAGVLGQEAAMSVARQADVVVVVGAGLDRFTTRLGKLFGSGTTLIRIDVGRPETPIVSHPVAHWLVQGDARQSLAALRTAFVAAGGTPSGWRESIEGLEPGGELRVRAEGAADGICADGRLDPRTVASRLAELLPQDRHVVCDIGHALGWPQAYWPVASPERMLMVGSAFRSSGLGPPSVVGAAAAVPGKTVVLSTGDGGGLMGLSDLETAVRAADSCVIVVWNDGVYGAELHSRSAAGLNPAPMMIPETDFAALASAFGATGVRVASLDDLDAVDEWREAGATGTILLDCRVSRRVISEHQREIRRSAAKAYAE